VPKANNRRASARFRANKWNEMKLARMNSALTIAGSDSGGGAGIQADLKTFGAFGVHGLSVITSITAQTPRKILDIHVCPIRVLEAQIEAVLGEFSPAAVKTGMLYSEATVRAVAKRLKRFRPVPLVVDPIITSTSGQLLLVRLGLRAVCDELLPLATLVTPNLSEAATLSEIPVRSEDDMRVAARKIRSRYGCAVLIKGGHLQNAYKAVDVLLDETGEFIMGAPFVKKVKTHGTGCTYSAAVTACLAREISLRAAVRRGKQYITRAIRSSSNVGGQFVLGAGPYKSEK
jgi:hydroxymethylpyrimidine/phosphomethylpyrimidine kinase